LGLDHSALPFKVQDQWLVFKTQEMGGLVFRSAANPEAL
jgi:hypothetical protein